MAPRPAAPPVSVDEFQLALRQIASPVGIITAQVGNTREGLTATAISFVTAEPPTMLVCINRDTPLDKLIAESGAFAVNFLSQEQFRLAHLFTMDGAGRERLHKGVWTAMVTGSPVLEESAASFDCQLERSVEAGTHNVHIGRIVGVAANEREILLHRDGLLRRIMPLI